jgi:hypothetical protein
MGPLLVVVAEGRSAHLSGVEIQIRERSGGGIRPLELTGNYKKFVVADASELPPSDATTITTIIS